MKLDVTSARLEAIKSMADEMSAMIGSSDNDDNWARYVKHVDNLLKRNNLPKRDFA